MRTSDDAEHRAPGQLLLRVLDPDNSGDRRSSGDQVLSKLVDIRAFAFNVDLDVGAFVGNVSREMKFGSQSAHERPKADSLHDSVCPDFQSFIFHSIFHAIAFSFSVHYQERLDVLAAALPLSHCFSTPDTENWASSTNLPLHPLKALRSIGSPMIMS